MPPKKDKGNKKEDKDRRKDKKDSKDNKKDEKKRKNIPKKTCIAPIALGEVMAQRVLPPTVCCPPAGCCVSYCLPGPGCRR